MIVIALRGVRGYFIACKKCSLLESLQNKINLLLTAIKSMWGSA